MGIRALVICPDAATLPVLADALQKVSVVPIACDTQLAALDLLWQQRFDAVIVDCDSLANTLELVKLVRLASGRTAVVLSLVTGEAGMKQAFEHGANLVLEKPVTVQNAERTLRAASWWPTSVITSACMPNSTCTCTPSTAVRSWTFP